MMHVHLVTCLLLAVVGAAGQCNDEAFSNCVISNGGMCESQDAFTGEALCACYAQVGMCAKRFNCVEKCVDVMAVRGCGAAWCQVTDMTMPIKLVSVYRFTKGASDISDVGQLARSLSPAVSEGIAVEVADISNEGRDLRHTMCAQLGQIKNCHVQPEFCTMSNGKCIPNLAGPPLPATSVCPNIEEETVCHSIFGDCLWKDNKCEVNNGPLPGAADVRPFICMEKDACSETPEYCKSIHGQCVPDPEGPAVPAIMVCPELSKAVCTGHDVGFCRWTGSKCTAKEGTHHDAAVSSRGAVARAAGASSGKACSDCVRAAEVSENGQWQVTVYVRLSMDGFVNAPLAFAIRQQMNQVVASSKWAPYGASLHRPSVIEVGSEDEDVEGNAIKWYSCSAGALVGGTLLIAVAFMLYNQYRRRVHPDTELISLTCEHEEDV
eukprot:TRINITY_DN6552_c0_g1_i1.p1 TRINITY_DN6552_c0_g1~~TRINITY_DN6552_c0_g1_i1.p1  ORF type:complete len:448 (+),score=71.02 TRINITY_DN6552_c0_g1_i1:39-1346(+)